MDSPEESEPEFPYLGIVILAQAQLLFSLTRGDRLIKTGRSRYGRWLSYTTVVMCTLAGSIGIFNYGWHKTTGTPAGRLFDNIEAEGIHVRHDLPGEQETQDAHERDAREIVSRRDRGV